MVGEKEFEGGKCEGRNAERVEEGKFCLKMADWNFLPKNKWKLIKFESFKKL